MVQQRLIALDAEARAGEEKPSAAAPPPEAPLVASICVQGPDTDLPIHASSGAPTAESPDGEAAVAAVATTAEGMPDDDWLQLEDEDESFPPTIACASEGGIDPVQELLDLGISGDAARAATQTLRARILAARALERVEDRHEEVRLAIDEFKQTAFGRQSDAWLHGRGWALVPLFSAAAVHDETSSMTKTVEDNLLYKVSEGHFELPENFSAPRINGEHRYMVDPNERRYRRKSGDDFVKSSEEVGETLAFVVQALDYGYQRSVDVEKLTLLLSAAGKQVQILHKDQDGAEVSKRLDVTGSSTRGAPEPAPYSAVCAFQDDAVLHVIEASHKDLLRDDFDWGDTKELKIPRGWGLLFHSCLVHAGGSYESVNGRLHFYLKMAHGLPSVNGKFKLVENKGVPPGEKQAKIS